MADSKADKPDQKQPAESPTAHKGVPPHEMPDVKPLVDKAGAEPDRRIPQGAMKTGADTAGGGGTKTLEPDQTPQKSGKAPD